MIIQPLTFSGGSIPYPTRWSFRKD